MAEQAVKTIRVNYYGTQSMSHALLPLMNPHGRVVNVGSRAGLIGKWGESLQARFLAGDLTETQLDALVEEFKTDISAGTMKEKGWPNSTYGVSKAAVHALTRIHSRDIANFSPSPGVTVNTVCPGWCRTNMAGDKATKSAAEGADTPVWAALLPTVDAPSGDFFGERKPISWVSNL
jgi:carbonyl reductase 1